MSIYSGFLLCDGVEALRTFSELRVVADVRLLWPASLAGRLVDRGAV